MNSNRGSDVGGSRSDHQSNIPPRKSGLRGQLLGDASQMHQMAFQGKKVTVSDLEVEEAYDFVVAGAGISGLSAAFFYQKKYGHDKKILIVDPLQDFGGHATRNEFMVDGKKLIGYGGSESFQSPQSSFSDVMNQLMKDLNVDYSKFQKSYFQHSLYPSMGLSRGTFFNSEIYGEDRLVVGDPTRWVSDDIHPDRLNGKNLIDFVEEFPLSIEDKASIIRVFSDQKCSLSGLSIGQKIERLKKINYLEFLKNEWNLSDKVLSFFKRRTSDFFGLSATQVPALEACHYGFPGYLAMGVPLAEPGVNEPYVYHFPDGNASVARLLVRQLIPGIASGSSMEDVLLADFDYARLDRPQNNVRIRLGHSVNFAANSGNGSVDLGIIGSDGVQKRIRSKHCTLACFNMAIGHIVPELPSEQRGALKQNVKAPLVYSNVALRNWHPWVKLGVHEVFAVGNFHVRIKLDYPVKLGSYSSAAVPSEPILVHMVHVPTFDEADPRTSLRSARNSLFSLKFEDFEKHVHEDLTRIFGPSGFDAERDIFGITVNRWSHGYSYSQNSLSETEEEGEKMMQTAKRKVGNISIACSDAGWNAYANTAVDEAYRAVDELS